MVSINASGILIHLARSDKLKEVRWIKAQYLGIFICLWRNINYVLRETLTWVYLLIQCKIQILQCQHLGMCYFVVPMLEIPYMALGHFLNLQILNFNSHI